MTLEYSTIDTVFSLKGQRSRSQGRKVIKPIEGDRVAGVQFAPLSRARHLDVIDWKYLSKSTECLYEGHSKSFEPNLFRQGIDKRAHNYFLTYSLSLSMPSW